MTADELHSVAYRLKKPKALAAQLSRIVAKEFKIALEELDGTPGANRGEAVHDARKSLKKIRAVLRLLAADPGADYQTENAQLRTVARELSPLRDADATAEIVKSVRDHYPSLITPSIFDGIYRVFLARRRAATARLHPDRLVRKAARELRRSARSAVRKIRGGAGHATVTAGMRRGYRRARQAFATVRTDPQDAQFHAWRRRVKDHWYQVRLLEGLNAHAHDRAQRLKRLDTWLGDDHNLVLMRATIVDAPARFGDERATTLVLGCAAKYQASLRRRALKLGGQLFRTRSKVFRRSIDAWLRSKS